MFDGKTFQEINAAGNSIALLGSRMEPMKIFNSRLSLPHLLAPAFIGAVAIVSAPVALGATTEIEPELQQTIDASSLSGSFLAGQVAAQNNDDVAAVAFYERNLALDPGNEDMKRLYFLVLVSNGRVSDAVEVARDVTDFSEDNGLVRLILAVDSLKKKSWGKVADRFQQFSDGELDQLVETLVVAWAQLGAGQKDKAIELLSAQEGQEWITFLADYHMGLMSAVSGDDNAAADYLQKAVDVRGAAAVLGETYLRANEALVRTLSRLGEKDRAVEILSEELARVPNHPPYLALQETIAQDRPLKHMLTSAQQGGAEVFYNVGSALSRQNGQQFAQGYLQLANHLSPGSDVVAMALAAVFEGQKSHARANAQYDLVGKASPFYRRASLAYALNLNDLEKVDESKAVLRSLIEEQPDDLLAYTTLGSVLSQHEEYAEAAEVYDEAVNQVFKAEPHHWNLFYRRGIAYERIQEWDKAEPNFQRALELAPNQPDVLNYLGYSWIDMGIHLDEGMEMIEKAVKLKPRSGFIVDSLGWAHYKLGNYEDAVRELERAVNLMPQDPVINDHLGDAYWKTGRKLEATFQWNHSLDLEPTDKDAAKIRAKLANGLDEEDPASAANQ